MKKLLALVLALVMTMSLVTISNAAFSDADKIDHTEAVEVMNALGVINGMPDGSFAPAGNVTRAEMAKMISIISLGNIDPAAFKGTATDLTDINGHWAEGFIKYCYSQGVIAGRGDGTFAPNANVTAVEAAKMLLVAIGYNATVQGYVGADWTINVIRDAQLSKFFDDLSVTSTKVLTRDEAAQMIYNAINAKTITKNSSVDRLTGKVTDIYEADGDPLLKKTFSAKTWIGSFDGNHSIDASIKKNQIQVTGKLDTDAATTHTNPAKFVSDFDITNIGEEVKVIFKDAKGGTLGRPDEKDTIYGVYLTGATETMTVTKADIEDQQSSDAKITINGTKYDTLDTVPVVDNYRGTAGTDKAANNGTTSANSTLTSYLMGDNGDTIKFIKDTDGKIAKAYVTASTLTYVTAKNNEKITLNGIGAIKIADNDVYAGIAKDDVVVVTVLYKALATDDGAYTIVKKADVVSGEVTGFKNNTADTATEKITLNGTTYTVYNKAAMPSTLAGKDDVKPKMVNGLIGEKFDLYLVNGFVAAAVQTSESASNYSLVIGNNGGDSSNTFNKAKLEVLGADGVKTIITVDKDSAVTAAGSYAAGTIITYTGTADKALVKIQTPAAGKTSSTTGFYNKTAKTIEGVVTSGDAVLFVRTESTPSAKYKAYGVRSLKDITTEGVPCKVIIDNNSKVVAAYIELDAVPSGATASAIYGLVTAVNGTIKHDDTYYTSYTVWTTDGEKSVNIKNGVALTKGQLYKFEPTSDGYYDNSSEFTQGFGTQAAIKNYNESDKLLTYYTAKTGTAPNATWSGEQTYAIADDVKVLYVNQKDDKAGEEIGINVFDDVKDLFNAVIVMKGTTGDDRYIISTIIIETSNKVDAHIS